MSDHPLDSPALRRLLHQLDPEALGEGDFVAGVNVVSAMLMAIANIQSPGTILRAPDGTWISVGMNYAVAGSLSSALVGERVFGPLLTFQHNLIGQMRDGDEYETARAGRPSLSGNPRRELMGAPADPAVLTCLIDTATLGHGHKALLFPSKHQAKHEVWRKPLAVVQPWNARQLESGLARAHQGRPFVLLPGLDPARSANLENVCNLVMRGACCSSGDPIRGFVATTLAPDLVEAMAAGHLGTSWLNDGLLLTEEPLNGPDANLDVADVVRLGSVLDRFPGALIAGWTRRINHRVPPAIVEFNWVPMQHQWIAFLKTHEAAHPGITALARPLCVTLLFSLMELMKAQPIPHEFRLDANAVFDLAKYLVLRMVKFHAGARDVAGAAKFRATALSVAYKLEEGAATVRTLTRRSHRLNHADCLRVLEALESMGAVSRTGNQWQLLLPPPQVQAKLQHLTIDV